MAKRVEEELEKRKDEIEREVLRRVEEAKRIMERQLLEELERQRQAELAAQKAREVTLGRLERSPSLTPAPPRTQTPSAPFTSQFPTLTGSLVFYFNCLKCNPAMAQVSHSWMQLCSREVAAFRIKGKGSTLASDTKANQYIQGYNECSSLV